MRSLASNRRRLQEMSEEEIAEPAEMSVVSDLVKLSQGFFRPFIRQWASQYQAVDVKVLVAYLSSGLV